MHGDVFRAPTNASLLSVYVGTGMQLIGMGVVTMVFAVLGFLSPANRGGLMTAMLLLFVFMGIFGGYYSARLYKIFKVCAFLRLLTQLSQCAACLSWCLLLQSHHSHSPLVSIVQAVLIAYANTRCCACIFSVPLKGKAFAFAA